LTLVARKAAELSGADAAVVALLDEGQGRLVLRAGHGLEASDLGQSVALGEGAIGQAAARGAGVLVNDDPSAWPARRAGEGSRRPAPRAVMAYPLLIRGATIGVLGVVVTRDGSRLAPADLDRLASLAAPAALAIEHSRLYAQLERRLGELRETQAQLVQAGKLSAVGQLVSGVAHELNNPLSVVIGYGQLLLRKDLAPEMRTQLEAIVAQADRMARIVQGLLVFARQRPPERVRVDLAAVLAQTLALRATPLRVSGITVDLECASDLPPVVGDASQLQQVFLNLLLNAEQAMTEARVGDRIRLVAAPRSAEGAHRVIGQVIDNGPGIRPDVLPRIFEPFFTTRTVGSGTGLGLSVCYGIVEQHGGTIDVQSRPGATTFTVTLPAAPAE
jgi:two-component system NtrC family sensor kinase